MRKKITESLPVAAEVAEGLLIKKTTQKFGLIGKYAYLCSAKCNTSAFKTEYD